MQRLNRHLNMKTAFLVALGSSVLVLAGCGKKEAAESASPPPDATAGATPAEAAAAPTAATLSSIDSAIKSGAVDQAASSILAVQNSQRQMSVDDSLKVNDRMRQLQVRIAEMMASGDPRAKQAAQMLQSTRPR
jgi:flagellar motility protein MotE (MotC chaperone)